jgi:hypothetical protein
MGDLRQRLAGGEVTVDLGALEMVTGLTCSSHAPDQISQSLCSS